MKSWMLAGMLIAGSLSARADLIALWQNDALGGNEASASANTLGSSVDSGLMDRGAGGTATVYTNTFGMRNANSLSLEDAVLSNRYLRITLSADAGYAMSFSNVNIRLQAQNATAYEVYFSLFSDVTGYSAGDELTTWAVGGTGNSADWLGVNRSLDMSGVGALQGVSSAEFRLYIWGQQGGAFAQTGVGRAFQTNGSDDLRFEGTVSVVPEPGASVLIGLGAVGIALWRRRLV